MIIWQILRIKDNLSNFHYPAWQFIERFVNLNITEIDGFDNYFLFVIPGLTRDPDF